MGHAYEQDIVAWSNEQAEYLRLGQFDKLDIEHLIDEVQDVGKSEQRELNNRMAVLLCHLLKWKYQPERRSSSWEKTLKDQRVSIEKRVKKTPSLKSYLADEDWLDEAWKDAKLKAESETNIPYDKFPDLCLWPVDEILGLEFFPE